MNNKATAQESIVVANRSAPEFEAIRKAIGASYDLHVIDAPGEADSRLETCDLILLDGNFTGTHGIDFLKDILSRRHVPILAMIPVEEPAWGLESVHAGAVNYLAKTPDHLTLLDDAIRDALGRFNDIDEMKHTIVALRNRIAALEAAKAEPAVKGDEAGLQAKAKPAGKRESLIDEIVRQFRQGEITMPAYPEINLRLQELISKQAEIPEIARLLKNDAAISSRLIGASNSSRYSIRGGIKTVEQAVSVLGVKMTRVMVEVIANRALYSTKNKKYQPLLKQLWEHSMACAHAAQAVSRMAHAASPEEVFTMGLLHDIGSLLLLQIISDLETRGVTEHEISREALDEFLHAHHGRFGKSILDRWRFPEVYGQIALNHDFIEIAGEHPPELLVVHFANILANTLGYGTKPSNEIDLVSTESARLLGLKQEQIDQLAEEVRALVDETEGSLV